MDINILTRTSAAPVIKLNDIKHAISLATELIDDGMKTLKITLCESVVLHVIQAIKNKLLEYIAAGIAGADFAVVCSISSKLIAATLKINIPYMPAIATPSELLLGIQRNFLLVKFSSAILNSSMKTLHSFVSVFPVMRFCPTISID